jgi:hypothetical protein
MSFCAVGMQINGGTILRENYNILIGAKFKISKNIIIHMSNTNKMERVINKYTWCACVQIIQGGVILD